MPTRLTGKKGKKRRPTLYTKRQRKIGDTAVVRGVEIEFDRTLPFWRCYTDLRQQTGRKPEVLSRSTQLLCRIPCKVFKHVDVVWARTQLQLRCVTEAHVCTSRSAVKRPREADGDVITPAASSTQPPQGESSVVRHTIDTLHFVHANAYKKGLGSENSFHVQSVILRDAPAVLQCVAGAMVCFCFLIYTSLRLVHACETRHLHINHLHKELDTLIASGKGPSAVLTSTHARSEDIGEARQQKLRRPAHTSTAKEEECATTDSTKITAQLREWCPPSTSRVLILGMGGNSMAMALRTVLGPDAFLEVVEVEPAVVEACVRVGTLEDDDAKTKVHVTDADTLLHTLPAHAYDFIFMDIFEPMEATMKNLHPWVATARKKLTAGGLLVMNEHQLPSAESLAPYGNLFGKGNVQAVNLRGWKESVVVCVAPGNAETDAHTLKVSKLHTNVAFNIYEALLPGWLPHFSWLVSAKTHFHEKMPCRLWTS